MKNKQKAHDRAMNEHLASVEKERMRRLDEKELANKMKVRDQVRENSHNNLAQEQRRNEKMVSERQIAQSIEKKQVDSEM